MAESPNTASAPNRYGSLSLRLLLLYLVLAAGLGGAAFYFSHSLLSKPLLETRQTLTQTRQELASQWVHDQIEQIQHLSLAFNAIARTHWGQRRDLARLSEALLQSMPLDSPVIAAGIWPAPRSFDSRRERSSLYWTVHNGQSNDLSVVFHDDYNDPSLISYHGELWYAPMQHYRGQGCVFTRQFLEPFLNQPVISCAARIELNQKFLGVATLVIDPRRWKLPAQLTAERGDFMLLLDHQQQLLLASPSLVIDESAMSLADLAKTDPRFGPVAVAWHQQLQTRQQNNVDGRKRSEMLAEQARQLSLTQAEQTLAWLDTHQQNWSQQFQQESDGQSSSVLRVSAVPSLGLLVTGTRQPAAIAGQPLPFIVSAGSTAGITALAMLLAFLFARSATIAPLRKMLRQLEQPAEDTLVDVHRGCEIGALAEQFNARHDRIRELLERGRSNGRASRGSKSDDSNAPAPAVEQLAVLNALPDAIAITDKTGNLSFINTAAENLSGWKLSNARGLDFDEVFHLKDKRGKNRVPNLAKRAISAGRASERPLSMLFTTRSGHQLPVSISSSPYGGRDKDAAGAIMILHDGRNAQTSSPKDAAVAVRDSLTGVLNRLAFDAELANQCEATRLGGASPFHLLYLDIDKLHSINAAFGTEAGDELLRQIAKLIQSDVGDKNPVYRLHGDKFAVLMNVSDSAEAQVTAELLRADIQSWGFQWKAERREISVSVSSIKIDKRSGRPVDILRRAAALCEQAQSEGGGRVVIGHAHGDQVESRDDRHWLTNIKRGLTEDRFHLSTQQVKALQRNVHSGEVFDTLLLLEDEEGFWTGADVFMPAAVRHDVATQLDRWTVEKVFARLSDDSSLAEQIDFCMISISVNSMQSVSFLDFLVDHFQSSGVARAKICIDLDEQDVSSRLSSAREFCQALARAGCRLSLSRVSTKPSSLSLIKDLPVQLLRFDTSLTMNIHTDPVDRLATESLHRIAHSLNKQSMVTRVESADQLRIVQGIGVDYAQGNAVARATPMLFQIQA